MALARIARNGCQQSGGATGRYARIRDMIREESSSVNKSHSPFNGSFTAFQKHVKPRSNLPFFSSIGRFPAASFGSRGVRMTPHYEYAHAQAAVEESDSEYENLKYPTLEATKPGEKPRVVVIGSGWAACRFLKGLNTKLYDVVCISPRNHMVFTPLLASTCVGTLEFCSVAEPVSQIQTALAKDPNSYFFLASCNGLDTDKREVDYHFKVAYDKLVIASGAEPLTFGIKGVHEHAFFLREVSHAQEIRKRLLLNLMLSENPGMSEEEKERLLHCVVISGGPTCVEFSGELSDFIMRDVRQRYAHVKNYIKVTLIEKNEILSSFDVGLRQYATKHLTKCGVRLVRGVVKEVHPNEIVLCDGSDVPYGLLVWSTGVGPSKFVNSLSLPKAPAADVFAIGDCAGFVEGVGRPVLPALAQKNEILSSFDVGLRQYATKHLTKCGVRLVRGVVKEVHPNEIVLSDGSDVPYGLLVWSTGVGPSKFVNSLSLPKAPAADVFAIGDCAGFVEGVGRPVLPALAQKNEILSSFDVGLRQYATKHLTKCGVRLVRGVVKEVHPNEIVLSDGSDVPYGLLVWSTGVGPSKFVNSLSLPKAPAADVFAIGDCAGFVEGVGRPVLPALAQKNEILSSFDVGLRQYATKHLTKCGVRLVRGVVKEVHPNEIVLSDGSDVPYGLLVWSTGVGPSKFVNSLSLPKAPAADVFAIGDCAGFVEGVGRPVLPALAQKNEILSSFDVGLRQYATKHLTKCGVRLVRGVVKEVHPNEIVLSDGSDVPYGLLVWSTGVGPSKFVNSLSLPKAPAADVFAIGDCAGFVEGVGRPVLPALAQKNEILSSFDVGLRQYATKHLTKCGVRLVRGVVKEVHPNEIVLSDGSDVPYGLLVWSTGVGPSKFVNSLSLPKAPAADVFAIGDCAGFVEGVGRPVLPALAQKNEILSSFDVGLRQYATKHLTKCGVRLVRGVVKEVHPNEIVLSDGSDVPYGLLVWSTGVGPSKFVNSLSLPKAPAADVFAIGDCAGFVEGVGRPVLPALAQVAERQGKYLVELFNRMGKEGGGKTSFGQDDPLGDPFVYKHLGSMASVQGLGRSPPVQGITSLRSISRNEHIIITLLSWCGGRMQRVYH
ncbi:hypothetical protein SASPL_121315 [Salvia splendens]|uniref:FAD/NAD(P)-binding domain-containing protein n=1 Tax=Salvia splendens TaxID=180675 RepID=A0A8X8XRN2_SALSN|nr:hypothetical protein SASPL_121315 [Salvia splendens]